MPEAAGGGRERRGGGTERPEQGSRAQQLHPAALDHLVYAVPDLDAAVEELRQRTGVAAAPGGAHVGRGTRNALVALRHSGSTAAYLELLAPDPEQPDVPPERTMLGVGRLGAGHSPVGYAWAVRPADLDDAVARAAAAGIDIGTPVGAARRTPAGTDLVWRLAVPSPLGLGGVQPFLIDWGGSAHPVDDDLPLLGLTGLRAEHPDPVRARQVLALLGAQLAVSRGPVPALHARLTGPAGSLTF
ncbi:VOC family protein [uncultured Serinicoccus sp.]|uniref:VOC family protein n=1 Tax=uncultured Serinicoccus sp. TaxID=735514 RepID=UPI00262DF292|nr:VOC family protein [uncultured Serinicoccus sp.]